VTPIEPAEEARLHAKADELVAATGAVSEIRTLTQISPTIVVAPPWRPAPRTAVAHVLPSVTAAQQLLTDTASYLASAGIEFDTSTVVDLLAAYLSSQFLMFAGPSGTGKSTAARALGHIFCASNSLGVVEGRRQMIGPEDIAGYYSPLAQSYVRMSDLKVLRQLAVPAADSVPALLVEEINLSAVEGYLAPFTHGMSRPTAPDVPWELHDVSITDPPDRLVFGPFPRLLGTINVDATAMAPAPKVTARACVLVLEPADDAAIDSALQRLKTPHGQPTVAEGAGAALVGNPAEIFASGVAQDTLLVQQTNDLVDLIRASGPYAQGGGSMPNPVSRRQVVQLLTYASWFVLLAEAHVANGGTVLGDAHRLGVENALLHFVLPILPGVEFGLALQRLQDASVSLTQSSTNTQELGAVLLARVERLMGAGGEALGMGRILDFWDRLS
jgi:DNA polymerase III delta prime subunit